MSHVKLLTLFSCLISLHLAVFAQQDSIPVTTIVETNTKHNTETPIEKVYLHFDKPYYAVGDTLWFKAYVTSLQNIPSPLSKIVYVDILSSRDSLVGSLKLPVVNSIAHGSIPLDHLSYKQGNYHIRAYTKWMLNFSSSYFFSKNIPLGNAINKELNTHISFTNSASAKKMKVTATVRFKDEDGTPYMGKKVNWQVIADYDEVDKGKGTTNNDGVLSIEFSSPQDVPINTGHLLTSIDVGKSKPLTASFSLKKAVLEKDVQFFPEGGELVAGLNSQIAFKAIQSDGLGIDLTGEIVDPDGKVMATISSTHLGMGKFSLTPENDKIYFANVVFKDGSKETYTLPKVQSEGIALTVDNKDTANLKITIQANEAYLQKHFNEGFYIIGRNSGIVYYAAQSVLRNPHYTAAIPKGNFPSGVTQLTILSSSGKVLSERLAFVRQADTLDMALNAELPTYKQRQQVDMSLKATYQGKPVEGNFSVAVIDEKKVPFNEDKETTILNYLLLSSDIEGYIENPNYYFHHVDDKKREAMDLLMLTQGYRRYLYENIVSNTFPPLNFLPEQGLAVSGIIRRKNGMPLENGKLLLQIPSKSFYKDGSTDEKGRFSFNNLVFQDSVEVVVNARNNPNSQDMMINIDGEPFPSISGNKHAPDEILNMDSVLHTYLENSKLRNSTGFILEEVEIEGRAPKGPSHNDHAALTGLSMQPDYFTKGEQLAGCNNLLSCLSTALGLTYVDNYLYLTRSYNAGNRMPVEIYVNGMPVDISYLQSVRPQGVESIEVFLDDGFTGINQRSNTNGVVVINMKEVKTVKLSRQEVKDLFPPANVKTFTPRGYSMERQFYSPKYSGPRTSLQSEDTRSTIYWNPLLLTDKEGNINFGYFTADKKGTYRVVVEGLDNKGYLGRAVYRYQVE